jgi:2-methylcitrate dehydratase PrpD
MSVDEANDDRTMNVGDDRMSSVDRRLFLGAGASALLGVSSALAQQPSAETPKPDTSKPEADGRKLAQIIADYVSAFDIKAVPQPVIDRARVLFTDSIGVMLAGSQEHVSHLVLEMVKAEGAATSATIVGQSLRTSPQLAALANGVSGHAMDYDFTYVAAQSIAPVIPAILPLAETTGATPSEAIAAFIIGAEVASRIIRSNFKATAEGAWHTTGMVGVIASAAAAARLLKVPAAAIPDVIGMSASLASGFVASFGTMTKPLHAGQAARNGVMAAMLGKSGFTANPSTLEARTGYFATFGRGFEVTHEPFKDLGRQNDLVAARYRIKPYPCGGLTHTAIEAALDLREFVGTRLSDIKGIHCFITSSAGQRAGAVYPATIENAKFSVAYLVPYALIHGAPKIAAFTEKALHDDRVRALAKTVTASVDPDLGPGNDDSPARIRITLTDGQMYEQRKDFGSGSNKTPMTQAQIDSKFMDCATQVIDADTAQKILAFLGKLPEQESFSDFWPLLRRG